VILTRESQVDATTDYQNGLISLHTLTQSYSPQ